MINWNEALFGLSEAGTRALEELATLTGGTLGPPRFGDRCSWHRDHPQSKTGSAVLVWTTSIGFVHAATKKVAEAELHDLSGATLDVDLTPSDEARCTLVTAQGRVEFTTTPGVARSIQLVAGPDPGWWQNVGEWPAAVAATLLDHTPGGQRYDYPCLFTCRPAGVEIRTDDFGSRLIPWDSLADLTIEGADELHGRPSAAAVLAFGVLGLALLTYDSRCIVVVESIDGQTLILAVAMLPAALRGHLAAILDERNRALTSAIPPPPPGSDPPAWRSDPTARHQVRWWDGQWWTEHVADNGVTAVDHID